MVRYAQNKGYGGNQKTWCRLALERGTTLIIMPQPDYQYDPKLIEHSVAFIEEDYFDVMPGSRIRNRRRALAGGMPLDKYKENLLKISAKDKQHRQT